ncbi:hypothetical protein AB0D49_30660 [Streptomyces sp. NPDC048290]|uniref:hypothetical protein n=1 Tax=Streptomyces sp. NPDC048290 TaxID=3155811 RepID=UPI00342845EF
MASVGKETGLADQSADPDDPVCVAEIVSLTDTVLGFRLGTTTRQQMNLYLPRLANELNVLLDADLGAQEDREVREIVRRARSLVELPNRPTSETPTFKLFIHLRDIANLSRRLLWIYTVRNDLDVP